ncbi:site-specific DNA-methyltransferase [Rickettsiales bacterium]|nr:site-specific DNA-methyltransferase [Rickettsiales bacterium]
MNTKTSVNPFLRVEQCLIVDLKPYKKNSKIHDKKQVKQIAASIKEFGFNVPILIDGENNIIAGHGRVLACKELGIEEIPTISIEHLSDTQKRAFLIADNKLTENAEWDKEMLALEFKELGELDLSFDLDITGFSINDIDFIIGEDTAAEGEEENLEEILQASEDLPVVTKSGNIWILGRHKLMCGDSRDTENYKQLMGNLKADMVVGDPPYNVKLGATNKDRKPSIHKPFAMGYGEMSEEEYTEFLAGIFKNLAEYSKDGSIHYVFINWRNMYAMHNAGRQHYTELKNICVWNKPNAGMGTFYRSKYGLVFVFKNGDEPHINNFGLGEDGRFRTNVWDYPSATSFFQDPVTGESRNDLMKMHPTVLPVSIFIDMMLDCSKPGSLVLDPFNGSGTSIIAAEKTGRKLYGMEYEPKFVDAAIRRWQAFTGKEVVCAETKKTFNKIQNGN